MDTQSTTHFIFSSMLPLVRTTIPHSSSLKAMPLLVPPQAWYSHSATSQGTPSQSTSWTKASKLKAVPFAPAHLLNASRIRLNSLSDTANKINRYSSHSYNALLSTSSTGRTSFHCILVRYKRWFRVFRTHIRVYVTIITFLKA